MNYFYLLITILLFQPDNHSQKNFTMYTGGRWGYSTIEIKLYSDSTYEYFESAHYRNISDNGTWKKDKKEFVLNSSKKTRSKTAGVSGPRKYRFKNQLFSITGDTLQLIPKEAKEISYYKAYYKMIRVKE